MSDIYYVFEDAETTHAAFARKVARRACALPACGGDVVALSAGNGPDFVINLFALWKAGAVPFLVSTRLPWGMTADLMDAANARLLITDRPEPMESHQGRSSPEVIAAACECNNGEDPLRRAKYRDIYRESPMRRCEADPQSARSSQLRVDSAGATESPTKAEGLSHQNCHAIKRASVDDASVPEAPAIGGERGEHETAVILHTSGTTGAPKFVPFTRANLLASLSFEEAAWDGLWTGRDASLGWLPLYHAFGLMSELLHAYCVKSRYYFSEANARALLGQLEHAPITLFSSVPWMLEEIVRLPGGLAALARLRWVVVGGSVTGPELGQKLVAGGVRLIQQYGMTEVGCVLRGSPRGDWRDLLPVIPAQYWRIDNVTGQLIVRPDCPTLIPSAATGELATHDVFDYAASGALRYRNRFDDVLVHVNGEKSDALAIERMVLSRAGTAIDQFVVAGSGRLSPACLVVWKRETPAEEDREVLRRALNEANQELPGHSQLHHELVLSITPSERGRIPLSPKGTVIRRAVEEVFRNDLDQLYRRAEGLDSEARNTALVERLRALAPAAARAELRALVCSIAASVLGIEGEYAVDPEIGFAEQGVDSLMAVRIRASLQTALGIDLPATLLFDAPTVDRLTKWLLSDVLGHGDSVQAGAIGPASADEPIAIVGASCRLPEGVDCLEDFWQFLVDRRVAGGDVPASRWSAEKWYDPDPTSPGRTYVKRAAFLRDVQTFDAAFFRIAPREARSLDPQQRLLLEVGWEALEEAGLNPDTLRQSATGVFVGASAVEYAEQQSIDDPDGAYAVTGGAPSVLAGRLSFFLGLHGPSLAVDTACSSSLTAVHLACQSLRSSECAQALVGAANVLLSPRSFVALSRLRALSPDGHCKPFAAAADGFGRAEGCVVVVLKRLSDADREGDRILALIRGSAINHDGPSSGLTVPSGTAQQAVIRNALAKAGVAGAGVDLVECHGTGTPLGDPIEVQALAAAYGPDRPQDRPLQLGAVKANFGHLEAAAGLVGLLKLALAFGHERIPGQPPFGALNPHIEWTNLPVTVVRDSCPWPRGLRRRLAAVSAFGLSGTNAHVILEEPPEIRRPVEAQQKAAGLFVLSAKCPEALNAAAGRLRNHLVANTDLSNDQVAWSLATSRAHLELRMAITASSREELLAALESASRSAVSAGVARGRDSRGDTHKVVFVFPGHGSQWKGMGRELLSREPVFRAAIEQCASAIHAETGWSPIDRLFSNDSDADLERIDVVQPILFAIQVGLSALWRSWGIHPDAVVGHSMGEVAAAYVAGALSLADAAAVIVRRSSLLQRIAGQGEMAVVELSLSEAEQAISEHTDHLSVAASNGPRSTVIAGDPAALAGVIASLEGAGVFARRVKVGVASHSPQVDPLVPELVASLEGIGPLEGAVPLWSTVAGAPIGTTMLDALYWGRNLRQPVRFAQAVNGLVAAGYTTFVEISPHPLLVQPVLDVAHALNLPVRAIGSLRRGCPEQTTLLDSLGWLYVHGARPAWAQLYSEVRSRVPLPTYPWHRQRYWNTDSEMSGADAFISASTDENGTLLSADIGTPAADKRSDALETRLCEEVSRVLRLPGSRIDRFCPLNNLGLDSLGAVELHNQMRKHGANLELAAILGGACIAKLAEMVRDQFDGGPDRPRAIEPAPGDPWIVVPRPRPRARVRLLCFPYAGGGPGVFARWAEALPEFLELGIVHLPGRGSRLRESPITGMDSLVDALTPSVRSYLADLPYAFLGHSLGALILFEVAGRLRRAFGETPVHLFVSGARAPHYYHDEQLTHDRIQYSPVPGIAGHDLADLQLVEMLRDLGFEASRALETDEEMRRLMLPTLRADLRIHDTYRYAPSPPFDIPITAVGGRVDPFVTGEQLQGWRRHTTGPFTGMFRPGGHYFLERERTFWAELLSAKLAFAQEEEPLVACAG